MKITLSKKEWNALKTKTAGYSGLSSIEDSDMASDMAANINEMIAPIIIKELKKNMTIKENKFNTDGIVNVALYLKDVTSKFPYLKSNFFNFVQEFILKFEQFISQEQISPNWESEKNKQWHIDSYKNILNKIIASFA